MFILPPAPPVMTIQIQQEQTVRLIRDVEAAFVDRRLDSFHNSGGHAIKVIYEHSLEDPAQPAETILFSSFAQIEHWLRSREFDDTANGGSIIPVRTLRPGRFKTAGLFLYDNQGISHNHLYLKSIRVINTGGIPAITEIIFYDGD